ncbi:hypothetical protein T12_244 [Trichinella patagoniensis]|uniref:Uncharacterized protein n=1 Tax=Trichinella patagoniensis TaxID=990121 RepID=A0A0V0ZZG4_9BILA|nr:hypothetical protein T12_244 [Trichinella patagoniensis]
MKKLQKQYPALLIYATQMIYGQISEMKSNYKITNDSYLLHLMCDIVNIHHNPLQTLSIQFIAQQCAFNALRRPEPTTLIKRRNALLMITQPCHVN